MHKTGSINDVEIYRGITLLKGKEHKNSNELCLNVFGKLHILGANCMEIGHLLLKIM